MTIILLCSLEKQEKRSFFFQIVPSVPLLKKHKTFKVTWPLQECSLAPSFSTFFEFLRNQSLYLKKENLQQKVGELKGVKSEEQPRRYLVSKRLLSDSHLI